MEFLFIFFGVYASMTVFVWLSSLLEVPFWLLLMLFCFLKHIATKRGKRRKKWRAKICFFEYSTQVSWLKFGFLCRIINNSRLIIINHRISHPCLFIIFIIIIFIVRNSFFVYVSFISMQFECLKLEVGKDLLRYIDGNKCFIYLNLWHLLNTSWFFFYKILNK